MNLFQEKRAYPRVDTIFSIKYSSGDLQEHTRSKNLSLGGVSFEMKTPLHVGEPLSLTLRFEGVRGELNASGCVVRTWSDDGKEYVAIEFTDIDSSHREIIRYYTESFLDDEDRTESAEDGTKVQIDS